MQFGVSSYLCSVGIRSTRAGGDCTKKVQDCGRKNPPHRDTPSCHEMDRTSARMLYFSGEGEVLVLRCADGDSW